MCGTSFISTKVKI